MRLTKEDIESKQTESGGYTKKQLKEWGIDWPPPKGWKERLILGDKPQQERVLTGYNLHRVHETKDMYESNCSYCSDKSNKLPHPFKCSKCEFIATNRRDLTLHWIDEH